MAQEKFKKALKEICDVLKFEMWLRFYFATSGGNDGSIVLNIPEEILAHIQKEYEALYKLANELNGKKLTPEISQRAVLDFILKNLEGEKFSHDVIPSVLNSKAFEIEISVFHLWVSAHEDQLDEKVYDFRDWMQLFEAWKRTEKGQNVLSTLHSPGAKPSKTTQ